MDKNAKLSELFSNQVYRSQYTCVRVRTREKRVKNMDKTKCQTTTAALPQRRQAIATLAHNAIEDSGSAVAELRVLCFEYSFIKSSTLCAVCGLPYNINKKITNVIRCN